MYRSDALADKQEMSPDLDTTIQSGANEAFAELDLVDLNVILHRADGEEKDATGMFLHSSSLLPTFLSRSVLRLPAPIQVVSALAACTLLLAILTCRW